MRRGISLLAGVVAALLLAVGPAAAETLRILAYEGYADQDWVAAFEKETGAKVNVVFAGSPEEMFAKMQGSGGADYDLVAIDTSIIKRYKDNGLIQPIDESKIPNLHNLLPAFATIHQTKPDGQRLAVPIAWGSLGLIYSKAEFPTAPDDWNVLWDPKYKGRVLMGDDGNNNIVNTAISLGIKDPYHLTPEQQKAIKAKLIALKSNLLSYYSGGDEGVTLWLQNDVVLMTAFGELQQRELVRKGANVGYLVPKAGAVGWVDCWGISAKAAAVGLAHAWINFWMNPSTGKAMSDRYGYGNTTSKSVGLDYADRLVWLSEPEDYTMRTTLWNEVKAAPAP
jgi:putative spermidine/putrescine transport system substrate-binding protein/spermidine/putrescine transport system substrate-binding protein